MILFGGEAQPGTQRHEAKTDGDSGADHPSTWLSTNSGGPHE
jgi:hypothetical protein